MRAGEGFGGWSLDMRLEGADLSYLSPGVCVEEVESGFRPVEGVGRR